MLVKYKTILKGDKALEDAEGKGIIIDPTTVEGYSIIQSEHGDYAIEYCCSDMMDWIKQGGMDGPQFSRDYWSPEPAYGIACHYPDDSFDIAIYYCPFCGAEIHYEEVLKVKLKAKKKERIKYIDYVEEIVSKNIQKTGRQVNNNGMDNW